MKTKVLYLILVAGYLYISSLNKPLFAESAGQPLLGAFGAKATGAGGAISAIVDDPSALYWNPAGLARINGKAKMTDEEALMNEAESAFSEENFEKFFDNAPDAQIQEPSTATSFELQFFNSYDQLTMDRLQVFSAIGFTIWGGTFGIGGGGVQVTGIDGYDENAQPTGSITYSLGAGYLGYARESGMTRVGLAFNGFQENLGDASILGGGINAGVQVSPLPILDIGLVVKNLLGAYQTSEGNADSYRKMDAVLGMNITLSAPPPKSNVHIMMGMDTNLDAREVQAVSTHFGLIMDVTKNLYAMVGLTKKNPSLGFGLKLSFLDMAYSINRDPLLTGFQHHVEMNLIF